MKKTLITLKGIDWLVREDGQIFAPARLITQSRIRNGKHQEYTSQWLERKCATCVNKSGYLEVCIRLNGVRKKALVHRLVGKAFVEGADESLSINHIDGNKLNNHPSNLEWVSLARNTQHQWETGLVDLRGENQPNSKLTTKQVVYIRRLLAKGVSAHALSVIAGVSSSLISKIKDGNRWAHVVDDGE